MDADGYPPANCLLTTLTRRKEDKGNIIKHWLGLRHQGFAGEMCLFYLWCGVIWANSTMFKHAWSKAVPSLLHFYRIKSHSLSFAARPAPVEKSSCFTHDFHTTHIDPHVLVNPCIWWATRISRDLEVKDGLYADDWALKLCVQEDIEEIIDWFAELHSAMD